MSQSFMGLDGFIWFVGVVEDRNDPALLGRVRVRCLGFHTEDKEKIPTSSLPWSHIMFPIDTPSMNGMGQTPSFMVEGTWVVGFFRDAMEKQQPVIIGTLPGYPQTTSNKELGFNDPNAKYPKSDFLDESDINRLAKGGADGKSHTSIAAKEDKRDKGVLTAVTDQTWDEPASTYAAVYPFNHVYETESGHYKEFDDTEGKERISEYHKAGTFYEVDASGNRVLRVVGSNYEVIHGSNFVHVKGSANFTVDDTLNIKAKTINMVAETMNELYTLHNETTTTLTETYTTKTETATTGTTTYSSGDMIASNISLVGHQHRDNPGLAGAITTVPVGASSSVTDANGNTVDPISAALAETALDSLDLSTQSNVTLPTSTTAYPDTLAKLDATDIITQSMMANDAVGKDELKTLSTLLVKNSSGTTLKTVHGAGD